MSSPRDPSAPEHLDFADSLRGLAILFVLMVHIGIGGQATAIHGRLFGLMLRGGLGVQLFFVTSALTLFWSLRFRSTIDRRPLAAFYVRRLFRIVPLFWLGALFYSMFPDSHRPGFAPDGIRAPHVLATLFLVHGWYPTTINSVVPGGWSIAAEAMFYLMIPMLFRLLDSARRAAWAALSAAVIVGFAMPAASRLAARHLPQAWGPLPELFVGWSFPVQLPVFLYGIVLYHLIVWQRRPTSTPVALAGVGVTTAVAVALDVIPNHVLATIAFVGLAFTLSIRPLPLIVNPALEWLGKISYSVYIWHFAVLDWAIAATSRMLGAAPHSKATAASYLAVVAMLTFGLSIPVATISYFVVERPGIALGKSIIERMRWGRAVTTQA